jgi:hypothetical protein
MTRLYQNFIGGEIDTALSDSDTTLSSPALAALQEVSSPDTMLITLDPDGIAGAPEIVTVTAHTASATTATITRESEDTTARAHASGIDWVHAFVASDAGGSLFEIETVELSTAATSISFSDIPQTYRDLVIVGELRSDRSGNTTDTARIRVGNGTVDSGTNYRYQTAYLSHAASGFSEEGEGQTALVFYTSAATADAGIFGTIEARVLRYVDTTYKRSIRGDWNTLADSTSAFSGWVNGTWENTAAAIDVVQFTPVNGPNFIAGSYLTLYGRGRI